ncbi:MAG: aldehyde dehydrogenase family protein [Bdellovibrionaceae bacterium]|nr:aldehyde dehydrogenase family protein [Bdellovibrio sp.]
MPFERVNPTTGAVIGTGEYNSTEDADKALAALDQTFKAWRNLSYLQRQATIMKLATALESKKDFFAKLMTQEIGKPLKEAQLEVKKCYEAIKALCEKDLAALESKTIHTTYKSSEIIYEPLGVIYSIMPWNYPLWQVTRMVIPALLTGNTILLKHAEICAQTGFEFAKLFKDIYPEPLLMHLLLPHEMTEVVLSNPRVQGVSLTGSTNAGVSVAKAAAGALKKYVLELGGSDPYLVLADADLDLAAKIISQSRLMNAGQSCISAKRCLFHESLRQPLIEKFKTQFDDHVIGLPLELKTDVGPLAHPRFKTALKKQIAELKKNTSAECVYQKPHGHPAESAFVDLEIYLLKENSEWLKDQEFFAPVLLMIPFKTEAEAIAIANSTVFGLGGGVFSKDLARAKNVAKQMIAGQVAINDFIRSDFSLPFGGFKKSGVGRELGEAGFFEFVQTKVISSSK